MMMKHLFQTLAAAVVVASGLVWPNSTTPTALAYSDTRLMDDQVFDNVGSMNQAQIQSFLSGSDGRLAGGSTCLSGYQTPNFHYDGSSWRYGDITTTDPADPNYSHRWDPSFGASNISAATAIYQAAQQWGLNPQVIIATLQKEESLISGTSCDAWRYNSAMGYACPDSSSCDPKYAGLTRQILWGSWQLKFNKERSYGNTAWDGDGGITYVGFMTQGTFKRCDTCSATYYSGSATIDGQTINLENGATASLYTYTPHLGQSFPGIFESWFGPAVGTPSLTSKLYRLYKRSTDRHFYTTNIAEVNTAMGQGYVLEGVSFYVSTTSGGDLSPVYRLYNKSADYHFYTINHDEANQDTGRGFVIEGIAFYASNGGDPGVQPIFRLLNNNGTHFFTANAAERDAAVASGTYKYEGISFFAVPN